MKRYPIGNTIATEEASSQKFRVKTHISLPDTVGTNIKHQKSTYWKRGALPFRVAIIQSKRKKHTPTRLRDNRYCAI